MAGDTTLPATRRTRRSTSAVDKDNATVDLGAGTTLAENRKKAKSRSKSMGPGGLDALKAGSGNRRVSLAAPSRSLIPRSILKPTMPIPEIPGYKPRHSYAPGLTGAENLPNLFDGDDSGSSGTKVALRTEEEQQAAAREREEQERVALEKEIKDRREARRKSLANRRVSFAAEATLHTFHEVEYMHDSTTSTDSTQRRASSAAAQSPAPRAEEDTESDASDTPSTPPEQAEETIAGSPEDQRHLHQKKLRRSSGVSAQNNFDNQGDITMTSTVYDSDSDEGDDVAEVQTEASNSDSDSDNDGTMMTLEAEEMTSASLASTRYGDELNTSTSSLDGALREAAQRAVNQAREPDEDEEVIAGFKGWGKKAREQRQAAASSQEEPASEDDIPSSPLKSSPLKEDVDNGTEMDMDMDMTTIVGGIIRPEPPSSPRQPDQEDMSMDVTNVFGGIIPQQPQSKDNHSLEDEQTMEFTTVVGGIQRDPSSDESEHASDEDMSMDLTAVIGRVLGTKTNRPRQSILPSSSPIKETVDDDAPMDMTMELANAVGRILPAEGGNSERNGDGEATTDMDMTTAVGGIIKPVSSAERTAAKKFMEQEADQPEISTTKDSVPAGSPPKQPTLQATQEDSPGLSAFRGKGLRHSNGLLFPTTPKSPPKSASPVHQRRTRSQGPASPVRRPTSPARSLARSSSRTPSPKRQAPLPKAVSPRGNATPSKSPFMSSTGLFQRDATTGSTTPLVVLTPQRPKLSGVGVDRSGIGSPRVTELLDRRSSIGDTAATFSPVQLPQYRKAVTFGDPRVMEEEVDRERRDDHNRESGRSILEKEADDVTLNLKEMIEGLSPKKKVFKGRKSLHVGSARGILGKRPAELDHDSDTEEQDGVKRLKGHQGSPVKNIRLQQPPSKAETTGSRPTLPSNREPDDTVTPTTTQSPQKATTPKEQGRFRHVDNDQPTATFTLNVTPSMNLAELQPPDDDEERMHLQDFLNLTSIRFMELTTTKRRHTIVPSARKDSLSSGKEDISLEKCVTAGACTVPMLELYQHSCRELKKYISEGRRIVREIETETFLENPPLFREYISASPEFKLLMDNQFKNVKTHARLQSKAMWYEWRMKLQEGLREGLFKTAEGMSADGKLLDQQQKLLSSVLPALLKQVEALDREYENLEAVATELKDCDPEELESARTDLVAVDADMEAKAREIAQLREQLQETEESVGQLVEQKQQYSADIREAEKIREECRGWSSTEISALRSKVDAIEKQHGWAITGIAGTSVSMTYRKEIELVFDMASFKSGQQTSRIDLWYIAANREHRPLPSTTEKEFCLQCIRDHVRSLPQPKTHVSRILRLVSTAWDRANALANQVHQLNLTFPTTVKRTSDSSISVKSTLLLVPLQTKVEVVLGVKSAAGATGLQFIVSSQAAIVYGEQFNAGKMVDFLSSRISDHVNSEKQTEDWCHVVSDLHNKLLARGRK